MREGGEAGEEGEDPLDSQEDEVGQCKGHLYGFVILCMLLFVIIWCCVVDDIVST